MTPQASTVEVLYTEEEESLNHESIRIKIITEINKGEQRRNLSCLAELRSKSLILIGDKVRSR